MSAAALEDNKLPPTSFGGRHPQPAQAMLAKAIAKTNASSAKGACHVDKHIVALVPEASQHMLHGLCDLVWLTGLLHATSLVVNICWLAKPAAGWRPIALLTMVYQRLLRQGRQFTKHWNKATLASGTMPPRAKGSRQASTKKNWKHNFDPSCAIPRPAGCLT